MSGHAKQIAKLEKLTDSSVFVVASSWAPERAHDLQREGGRVFLEALRRRVARGKQYERATVILIGRGGHPAFSEIAIRGLRAHYPSFDAMVPFPINGAFSVIAAAADRVLLHPYAGVGAVDVGPVTTQESAIDAVIYEDVPALGGLGAERPEVLAGRLAAERHWKRMARNLTARTLDTTPESLSLLVDELGTALTLDAHQLAEVGIDASTMEPEGAEQLWSLFQDIELELGLLKPPPPRYTESDLADEVEFEMAMGLVGALVETTRDAFAYLMDTGRPHPETNVFSGEWNL